MEKTVKLFQTHIEVFPYKKGDCEGIELLLSKKVYYPKHYNVSGNRFKQTPIAYYIENGTLYIPRGISTKDLELWFGKDSIRLETHYDIMDPLSEQYKILWEPNSNIQRESIDFLSGCGEFTHTLTRSQLGLNLRTGVGKTFSTIASIVNKNLKALIIVHRDKIKSQWINTLKKATNIQDEKILNIEGSSMINSILYGNDDIDADIYLITHTSIAGYANANGWTSIREFVKKLRVGIKVFDEAHLYFKDTFMLDSFTNTYQTFYLTATFGRADDYELPIYNKAFGSVLRYGEAESYDEKNMRKHTISILTYFSSKPKALTIPSLETMHGLSAYKYINYELFGSSVLIEAISCIVENTRNLEGKVLITSPKIDSCRYIRNYLSEAYDLDIVELYSTLSSQEKIEAVEHKYISATTSSVQEGVDIKGLRVIINTQPIGNSINMKQLIGRLREYAPDKSTYFYQLVDRKIYKCVNYIKRLSKVIKEISENVYSLDLDKMWAKMY